MAKPTPTDPLERESPATLAREGIMPSWSVGFEPRERPKVRKDEETDELVFTIVRGAVESSLVNYRMPKTEGLTGWVVVHGQALIVNDARQDWRFSPTIDRAFGFVTRNMIIVPMKVGRRVIGAIDVLNKHSRADFTEIDKDVLSILARTAAFALSQFEE